MKYIVKRHFMGNFTVLQDYPELADLMRSQNLAVLREGALGEPKLDVSKALLALEHSDKETYEFIKKCLIRDEFINHAEWYPQSDAFNFFVRFSNHPNEIAQTLLTVRPVG